VTVFSVPVAAPWPTPDMIGLSNALVTFVVFLHESAVQA